MGLIRKTVHVFLCDRCGEDVEREDNERWPAGWMSLWFGPASMVLNPADGLNRHILLCSGCSTWHNRFLEGRKVAD